MSLSADNKDQGSDEPFQWSKLLIISLTGIAIGMYRDGLSAVFPFLQIEFDLSRTQLGFFTSLFFFFNMFMGLFSGRLIDLKGSKWGLVFTASFLGIVMVLHLVTPNFFILLILAALSGFGVSMNLPAANKGLTEWFPQKWRSTGMGLMSMAFPLGGIMAASLLPVVSILIGWRQAIAIQGLFALLCAILVLKFYEDRKKEKNGGFYKDQNQKSTSFIKGFTQLIKNKGLISISILGFFWGFISGSLAAHFALFLYLDYGLSESLAGLGFAVLQFGSLLGRPGWGLICDRLLASNKRMAFLYMSLMYSLLSLVFGFLLPLSTPTFALLLFLAFLAGFSGRGWQGLYFASVVDTVKEESIGISTGFSMFFTRAGLMLGPPLFGYIADRKGSYDLSWFAIGTVMLFLSLAFALPFRKKEDKQ